MKLGHRMVCLKNEEINGQNRADSNSSAILLIPENKTGKKLGT